MLNRRRLIGTGLGAGAALTLPRFALAQGKPFAGAEISVLLPQGAQFRAQEKRFGEFTALTGIKPVYNYVPYGQLRDKIATEGVAGSSAFDIICYQDSWGPGLAVYLQPIDDWLKRDNISMDRYPQAYKLGSQIEAKTVGLPVRGHPQMLFYRKDLLEQAGVQPPKSWDELVTVADAVQKASGIAGVAMYYGKGNGGQNLFLWLNHLWGAGSDIFADNFRTTRFNEPSGIEATQRYVDYLLKHKVAAPGSVQFVEPDAVNSVAQGNSAMVMVWWWVYPQLTGGQSKLRPEQVAFAPMPRYAPDKPASYALSLPFAISANSKKKEAAWEFMKWVSSPELEVACATDKSDKDTADIVVTHKSSFVDPKVNEVNNGLHRVAAQSLEGSRIMPQLKEWPQIAAVLESTISELATGSKPVKEGLDASAQEIDRILRRAGTRRT
jgi:multiple sugar transport system substrate-binding protein